MTLAPKQFQQCILTWFKVYGRKDLPWQQTKSPYRTWLSEIMLQQTQVATVIPYFQTFIQAFPQLSSLAAADIEEVLHLWSGLGYYARARNLHRCAQIIEKEYLGEFPQNLIQLQTLPGIGRSTAGAILALAFNKPASILDGNVKRVLTRFHAISGWTALTSVNKKLWSLAESYTPLNDQVSHYTQAMMDLGALICTRAQPKCTQCPLQTHCLAHKGKIPHAFPNPRPRKKIPSRAIKMLILINEKQEILLEKRPAMGIWGGLWSLPECSFSENIIDFCKRYYHCSTENPIKHTPLKHSFSHFHLEITPIVLRVRKWHPPLMESERIVWYNIEQLATKGLAAPVKKLLNHLTTMSRTIYCIKLQSQAEGLDYLPYPGELGQRIYQSISQAAWQQWIQHQTMLINEYRLTTLEPKAREFLKAEMEKFLFGANETSHTPPGYIDPH